MTRLLSRLRRAARDESGFSMIVVMGVLAVGSLFLAAGFAAADGEVPLVKESKDRKQAYAAAESGLAYYRFQLTRDNDYWTRCDNVPGPAAGVDAPVTQAGATDRNWRALPGGSGEYTIELLPAKGKTACVEGDDTSMLEKSTGTFRIRATGRSGGVTRSIVATFRRASFLDYLYFTNYETTDPAAYGTTLERTLADTLCAGKYRSSRPAWCREIQFVEPDAIRGPLHTNDNILTCNRPTFGRDENDTVEVSGPAPGYVTNCGPDVPDFRGTFKFLQPKLDVPSSNAELKNVVGAHKYTGVTVIRLNGNRYSVSVKGSAPVTYDIPASGVIYVSSGPSCTGTTPPVDARYTESADCGIVYLSGSYSKSLTIASALDIVIRPPAGETNGDVTRSGDALLGLIADNFIRFYHPVSGCTNAAPVMSTLRVDAAMLALNHSVTADNYDCGARMGNLTINGAIAQEYRGAVGTSSPSGFIKDYNYDDRLRFRSPPYFLTPVDAAWKVIRTNEQVPAAS